ncbi:MAG: helical backbone metal receptor [Burkholderiaceae bacterium]
MDPAACRTDAAGRVHHRVAVEPRIVSLVPSITELLFELGLGPHVVGRTGFCIHPREHVRDVPKLGGTKDVKLDALRALDPTHVIVNIDENDRAIGEQLERDGVEVIVTHPNTPDDNIALFRLLGFIFNAPEQTKRLTATLQREIDRCRERAWKPERVLYLIWRNPWMTVAADTYIARTLACVGWRVTTPEGGWSGAQRYPVVVDIESASKHVDRVLLSSEPFAFRASHVAELQPMLNVPVDLIDGEMTSWYGNRAIEGLAYLRDFRAARSGGA